MVDLHRCGDILPRQQARPHAPLEFAEWRAVPPLATPQRPLAKAAVREVLSDQGSDERARPWSNGIRLVSDSRGSRFDAADHADVWTKFSVNRSASARLTCSCDKVCESAVTLMADTTATNIDKCPLYRLPPVKAALPRLAQMLCSHPHGIARWASSS